MCKKKTKVLKKIWALLCAVSLLAVCCGCEPAGGKVPSSASSDPARQEAAEIDSAEEQLVAHAGGAVYGYRRTNSEEALDNAYRNGFRYIELDFERTSDGESVLIHDWAGMAARIFGTEGQRTLKEFKEEDTFMDLTLMDLGDLNRWLGRHPDCRIITDIRADNLSVLREIRKTCKETAGRFIPQAYSYEEYYEISAEGYEDIILTLYSMTDDSGLLDFAAEERPWAITIPEEKLDEQTLRRLSDLNIRTFAHTINTLDVWEKWHEKGLSGIYTDYFMPAYWDA